MKKLAISMTLSSLCLVTAASAFNTGEQLAYVGSFYAGGESLRQSSEFIDAQLFGSSGLSGGLAYADYDIDDANNRAFEGDAQTTTGSIAYVRAFDAFNLGLSLSYVDAELDIDATDANRGRMQTDGDGWLFSVAAGKQWERLALSIKGTVGELSFDSVRENTFAAKKSDYDATLYQVELVGDYALITNADLELGPFAKLGYASMENDGFKESNAADSLESDDFKEELPYAELGINATFKSFGAFVPFASLSVWQDLGDDEVEIKSKDGTLRADVPDVARTAFKGNVGFDYAVNQNFSLGASLGYFAADDIDGVNAALSAAWHF